MTDVDLRHVERALQAEPASIDLRRQHARLLQRAGDDERALPALDLAWRLGANDLWDELQAALAPRRLTLGPTTLAWIPAGPFARGHDDLDEDVAPARLVTLPGFYIALEPLRWGALVGFSGFPVWATEATGDRAQYAERFRGTPFVSSHDRARAAVKHLNRAARPPAGAWDLPSEAQWERAMRASYLRADGRSPYGLEPSERSCEWTRDLYEGPYAQRSGERPTAGSTRRLHAVRGLPGLPPPHHALAREAAEEDGTFPDPHGTHASQYGIVVRPVVVPTA